MKDEQPIIIRVKRKKHTGHEGGHGSWKIAYADFMTAMMAFFMIMWLISISNPQQLVQIADYFKTPLQVAITGGPRSSTSSSPIPGGGDDPTQKTGEVNKSINADDQKKKLDQIRLNRLRERLDQLIEADPKLRALRPHLVIDMVEEGLRIQIIDSENRPMFKTGSAEIEPYMRDILRSIAPMLNEIPNKISLSGHTDDFQYASGQRRYSNWELSADRANASRRELITGGLADGKMLRVVGMADTMKLKNRPGSDAANRRITLLVLNHDAEVKIEQENAESDAIQINDKDPSSFKQITLPGQPTLNNQKATSVPTTANGSSGGVTPVKTPSTGQPAANNQNVTSASATQSGSSGGVTPALTPSTGQPALNNQNAPSAPTTSTSTSTSTAPTQNGSSGGGTSVVTPSAGQPALNNQNATSAPTTQNGNSGAVTPVITLSTGQTAPPNPSGNDANKR